eukprot:TRINITY_DN2604_c0_g1_i1.p1 TRINITY_DN2604_c0_g1~~TRINITY_DN2604_c0_g1_i1.p1  ORF type:complete len:254 (-),score=51.53 TRINITY_DN2604_c0_g1_i1:50-811(-)
MKSLQTQLSNQFPFYQLSQQQNQPQQGFQPSQYQQQPMQNPYQYQQQQMPGQNQQHMYGQMQQAYSQPNQYNFYQNQPPMMNQPPMNQNINQLGPELQILKNNLNIEKQKMIEKVNLEIGSQQISSQSLLDYYLQIQQKCDGIDNLISDLDNKTSYLEVETQKVCAFIDQYDKFILDEANLDQYLNFSYDGFSKQVVEVNADNKAIRESLLFLENQFRKDKINLDILLNITKSLSEKEFWNKHLLKKCKSTLR